jgi:hypothetical protein
MLQCSCCAVKNTVEIAEHAIPGLAWPGLARPELGGGPSPFCYTCFKQVASCNLLAWLCQSSTCIRPGRLVNTLSPTHNTASTTLWCTTSASILSTTSSFVPLATTYRSWQCWCFTRLCIIKAAVAAVVAAEAAGAAASQDHAQPSAQTKAAGHIRRILHNEVKF